MACAVRGQLGQLAVRLVTVESKRGHEYVIVLKQVNNDTFCLGDGVQEQICSSSNAFQDMQNMKEILSLWAFLVMVNSRNQDFQCFGKEWNPPSKEKLLGRSTTHVEDLLINYHFYANFNKSHPVLS